MNLSKKDICAVPQEAVDNAMEAKVSGVDLSKNRISEFPISLEPLLPQISQLDVSFNRLETVPPLIGLATNLQYLNLSNNKLKQLPDELSLMSQLRELCISFNKFESIPSCVYNIARLEILVAATNQVKKVLEKILCYVKFL
jgi:Leucine-rich repeat (LRR) protein